MKSKKQSGLVTASLLVLSACAPLSGDPAVDDEAVVDGEVQAVSVLHSEGHYAAGRTGPHVQTAFGAMVRETLSRIPAEARASYFNTLVVSEETAPDGLGRFSHYTGPAGRGAIYWHPTRSRGAHAVYGAMIDEWERRGWETGYGYPVEDAWHEGEFVDQEFEAVDVPLDISGHIITWRFIQSSDGAQTANAYERWGYHDSWNPGFPSLVPLPCDWEFYSYPIGGLEEQLGFPAAGNIWCGAPEAWSAANDPRNRTADPMDI